MSLYPRSTDRPDFLDLARRTDDVLNIARKQPLWRAALQLGWAAEDLEQEVLLRVWRKQTTERSAYNPSRAGVGKYLHTVTRSVLSHIVESAEADSRGGQGGIAARELLGGKDDVGNWAESDWGERCPRGGRWLGAVAD